MVLALEEPARVVQLGSGLAAPGLPQGGQGSLLFHSWRLCTGHTLCTILRRVVLEGFEVGSAILVYSFHLASFALHTFLAASLSAIFPAL